MFRSIDHLYHYLKGSWKRAVVIKTERASKSKRETEGARGKKLIMGFFMWNDHFI